MTTKIAGQLEIDHDRGVIYFHDPRLGYTVLRICRLPIPIPRHTKETLDGYIKPYQLDYIFNKEEEIQQLSILNSTLIITNQQLLHRINQLESQINRSFD